MKIDSFNSNMQYTSRWHRLKTTPRIRRRIASNIVAINIMCFATAMLRLSHFGTDPYSCMNLGLSLISSLSFGTFTSIVCFLLFIPVLLLGRQFIKAGTIIYLILLGPLCDVYSFILFSSIGLPETLAITSRICFLTAGILISCLGVSFYLCSNIGLGPYDAIPWILEHRSDGHITYKWGRILCDCTCIIIGFFCGSIIGIGTLPWPAVPALSFPFSIVTPLFLLFMAKEPQTRWKNITANETAQIVFLSNTGVSCNFFR